MTSFWSTTSAKQTLDKRVDKTKIEDSTSNEQVEDRSTTLMQAVYEHGIVSPKRPGRLSQDIIQSMRGCLKNNESNCSNYVV